MDGLRGAVVLGLALAAGSACRPAGDEITVVVALLPNELPAYRAAIAEFERAGGGRVVVVPQQYADIRRALAAEAAAGRGTLDLVELDVYSLAPAAPHVAVLRPDELGDLLDGLDPAAVAAGTIDGLRFVPHRLSWQALINIAVTTNSIPYTGVTLPFVSFGGSSIVVSLVAAGVIVSVSRARTRPEPVASAAPLPGAPERPPAGPRPAARTRPTPSPRPVAGPRPGHLLERRARRGWRTRRVGRA